MDTSTLPHRTPAAAPSTTSAAARRSVLRSTVVQKAVMAVTGVAMLLFLTAHMVGNLKVFLGAGHFDGYAHWLRTIGEPALPHGAFLWLLRAGLTACLVLHVAAAVALARRARRARPVKYAHRPPVRGSYAARTMRWGGVVIALFVVYHLLDLTAGVANPVGRPGHPYDDVTADFHHWYVTLSYTVAVLAVGLHVRHGVWSATRTLGRRRPRTERAWSYAATAYAVLLTAGFLSVPFAVTTGLVG